jgi:tetratricopeptide (TPR) repeat protein
LLALPATVCATADKPRPVAELEREVAALTRLYHTATHHVSAVMPQLTNPIIEAQVAVRASSHVERSRAYPVLAGLYWLAANVLMHSGDLPRAQLASDRALAAAEQSGDVLRIGAIAAFHAMRLGWGVDAADGVAVAVDVAGLVTRDPRAETPAGTVVLGALFCYGATAAARAGDLSEVRRLLKAAGEAAERLGRDREAYGAHFGPANLASKQMGALANLDRPDEAVAAAERVSPKQLGSRMRIGHHCAQLAHAHVKRGQDERALDALITGLEAAPEVVRYHFTARELVHDMLRRCRNADERLRRIAREMNLPR